MICGASTMAVAMRGGGSNRNFQISVTQAVQRGCVAWGHWQKQPSCIWQRHHDTEHPFRRRISFTDGELARIRLC